MPYDLVLIDASSWIHRSFHARANLATSDGRPTGAIYGSMRALFDQIRRGTMTDCNYAVAVLDAGGQTFRHRISRGYKASRLQRQASARAFGGDDRAAQYDAVREGFEAFGVHTIVQPDVEADDVIAHWAMHTFTDMMNIAILSGDKDLLQLVSDPVGELTGGCVMIEAMGDKRGKVMDAAAVLRDWGVYPDQMASMLALMGDAADDIPGIPGIGPKLAAKLMTGMRDLEDVIVHIDRITNQRIRQLVDLYYDKAKAAYRLIRLPSFERPPLPVPDLEAARFGPGSIDVDRVLAFCRKYEMAAFEREVAAAWAVEPA